MHFIKESFDIAVISFFNWGAVSGTAVILRSSVSPAEYGFFSAFARIFYYVFALFQPLNQTFQPVFARNFSENKSVTMVYFRKAVLALILLLVIFAIAFTLFLPYINQLFLSNYSYLLASNNSYLYYIKVMLIWVSLVILNSFITLQYFVSNGLTLIYRNLYILNTLLSIISAIALINLGFGLVGFGLGLVIGELLYSIALFKFCKGFLNHEFF
jgi:O-antigen/teichoic acid export membrane protein